MKTQNLTSLLLMITALTIFSACEKLDEDLGIRGQGPVLEETTYPDSFRNIEVDVDADVYLTQDDQHDLTICAQGNILNNLCVRVENETLKINFRERVSEHERMQIYIRTPLLENLSTTRSASIKSVNTFGPDRMLLQIQGSGQITMEIEDAKMIRSKITGSGQIKLKGTTEKFDVIIHGNGKVLSAGLISQQSNVSITGQGKCEVHSDVELNVVINGTGKVYYSGNPATLHTSLSGTGKLVAL